MTTDVLNRDVLVRSVQEIRRLRGELEALKRPAMEPIAVVGLGCRMPGGADPEKFWQFLREGGNAVRDFPAERGSIDDLLDPTGRTPGTAYTAKAGYLEDVDRFDATFFGISPREAAFLDPQQRLLLEVTWEALEDAGQVADRLSGSATGVYLGIANHDYTQTMIQHMAPEDLEAYWVTSNASTFGAGRLSYVLGLNGPSLSVDASCASSLVAVHLAVQSLRSGECEMALAGGVNVILVPEIYVALSKSRALAPDGVCKTFDKAANGYVRGEGCGILVLRRLSDAQARGDRILGLIRGSAVTQDGRSSGMTVPNPRAQQEALRGALRAAGLHSSDVGYIEAHGTGTPLGDPIEMRALTTVMGDRGDAGPLRVGSVKTNIGHLEPAAGVAGLIKALLCLRHGEIPPHLNLTELNPELALDPLTVEIPTGLTPWPANGRPRIAGVSSFGASGTNAHMILEQAPATPPSEITAEEKPAQLLTLSARTPEALKELAVRYRERMAEADQAELADICYTASIGRSHLPIRMALTGSSPAEMRDQLVGRGVLIGQAAAGPRPKVVFLFTGQGSQYQEMVLSLAEREPLVKQILETADSVLAPLLGKPFKALVSDENLIDDTRYTQPCLVAAEYALAKLWMSWGVEPAALLGHSVGELAAACVAGVLPFEEALRLAVLRGRMMNDLSEPGSMAAVFAGVEQVAPLLEPFAEKVAVAAVNGPESIVLSGDSDALAELIAILSERGIRAKTLPGNRAFHSPLMDPVLNAFEAAASEIEYSAPRIPVISNRTGQPTKEYTARYWREHIRESVLFHEGMSALFEQGHRFFVEVGPAPTLLSLARRFAPAGEVTLLPSLRRGHDERGVLLESLGKLYVAGFGIDWDTVYSARPRRRVSLPTYPFQRSRHWFAPTSRRPKAAQPKTGLLGQRLYQSAEGVRYAARLDPNQHECLRECVMDGLPVVNIGVYLDSAFAATRDLHGEGPVVASGTAVLQGLVLSDVSTPVEAELHFDAQGGWRFFADHPGDGQVLHARGTVRRDVSLVASADGVAHLESHRQRMAAEVSGADFHSALEQQRNLHIGPSARWIEHVWRDGGEAVARMRAARPGEAERYLLHPGLTDAMFQLLFACLPEHADPHMTYALVGIDKFEFYGVPSEEALYCQALLHPTSDPDGTLSAEVRLTDSAGRTVAHATGVAARPASRKNMLRHRASLAQRQDPIAPINVAASPHEAVLDAVAQALRADKSALDPAESLQNQGLDSLMALEVRDALSAMYGIQLPLVAFLEGSSVFSLGDLVGSLLDPEAIRPPKASPAASGAIVHDVAGRHEPFGLTDLQQAYLVGRSGALPLGNISTYFYLEVDLKDIDLQRLTEAWNHMLLRHDMLRATVTPDGQQQVLAEVPWYEIAVADLRDVPEAERERQLTARHDEMKNQVLGASSWPLFDIRASRLDDEWTRLHVGADALTMDAWSTGLVFAEWSQAYHGDADGLPDLAITFRDYLLAARALEGSAEYERSLAYWRNRLPSLPPPPELPTAVNPAAISRPEFTHRAGHLDAAQWAMFKAHAQAIGVTPSAALCTAYAQVLAAWSRSPRFTLNLLFLNRLPLHPDVNRLVGNFTTTTLLETDNAAAEGFHVKAERLQKQLWTDLEHSRVSGVRVLREMSRARPGAGLVTMPIVFASTVNFGAAENPGAARSLSHPLIGMGSSGHERWSSVRTPQVWLDHQVLEQDGGIVLNWDAVDAIFPEGMVDEMFAAYLELLHQLCDDEHAWRRPAPMMVQERALAQRRAVNATDGPLPGGLLHHRFQNRAAERPDAMAVIAAGRSVTYGELQAWSNRIGNLLRSKGIGRGALVGVVMHKSVEQIAAVLGILKAGAAYVPIDAASPEERIRVLIEAAGIEVVLTQLSAESTVAGFEGLQVFTVDGERVGAADPGPVAESGARPEDLAYVIFTSGSTGVPKGVMIEHVAAVNTVCDINSRFGVTAKDRVLALSALHFDLSVYDIFGLLGVGGAVVLPEPEAHREPARWLTLVKEHRVTIWNSVPMLMEMFAAHLSATEGEQPPLRLVMLSGDWVAVTLPDRIKAVAPKAAVWSLGGATEAAIWSIAFPIDRVDPEWVSIPYGKPLRNQQFHVLDESMRPCPVWVPGHLYIAGAGLARGYLKDERKTRASFPRHPVTGERVYRTGDLGRYLPDGNIEFLGREDFQVKVQGYRIELGEIEAALLKVPGVRAAVAKTIGERHESKRLLGYVVADGDVSTTAILAALRETLPDYYVPQQIVMLPELPLSSNGKVDRSRLPKPDEAVGITPQEMVAPRNDTERGLAGIWSEFFQAREISVTDSFFDLGGDSLLAVRLMARIENRLGLALPVSTLFSHPTIAGLATLFGGSLTRAKREALVPIRPNGTRRPLFFVHPVSGDVLCYSELAAQLDEQQPFYALQVPESEEPLDTIQEMAAHYVQAIAKVAPTGPYKLGGWSMGGVIALEMARQIMQAGGEVDQLVVIDLLEPPGSKPETVDDADLLSWLGRDLGGLAGLPWQPSADDLRSPDAAPLQILLELARIAGALPADLELRDFEPIAQRFIRNSRALLAHDALPYAGRVRFIRARHGATRPTARRWLKLLTGDAAVVDVPGGHYSIMRPPHLKVLAGELRAVLDTGVVPSTTDTHTDKEETR